jgi:HK97 family phage prohead protease
MNENFATKAIPGQLSVDEAEGIVECFVAGIGNKDSVGDICMPGAFTGSLARRRPRVVWGHDWNHPIGKVLEIYEVGPKDPRLPAKMRNAGIGGLFARVQFNLKSERGREAFANVVFFGADQEWSIGYKTLKADYDNARQANLLREVELYEVSPVLHGANQLTATISIKADNSDDRVTSFKKSKWPMFDRQFAAMIKEEHPKIWDAGGNIKGDDQYTILTKIAEQGGVAQTEDQIKALELREAWVARHEGDFLLPGVIAQIKWLAIGSRGEDHMKKVVREQISKNQMKKKADGDCPPATQEVAVNLKNRQKAIETAGYGPLNPAEPNVKFWAKKADRWDVTAEDAKKQICGNCAAFIKSESMLDCIKQGLGNEPGNDAIDVIEAGDLGYCEAFDFKCASARTCDAWISGGPVTEEKKGYGSYEDEPKGHGYGGYESEGSSEDDPMEELGRIAMRMQMSEEEGPTNDAMGRRAVLARALANELRTPVRIRTITGNTVVFDVMGEDEEEVTMRSSWHAERGQVMIGRPEMVRVETVYLPVQGDTEGEAYMGDEEFKAPTPVDAIPQERFTGDVLRGRGPRRGNLERLLRYWRPIMRKPGGFRRCLVILADHPELYPLQNICAWLHHETTGLWPNEGCHHPGMKNCRRKLRGVVRGSLWSDSEFNNRLDRLKPDGGKGMPDPFEMDEEKEYGEVTDDDVEFANKVLNWFAGEEKDFMRWVSDDRNWMHEGETEDNEWYEHDWVKPEGAPEGVTAKPGGCGCGCSGKGSCGTDIPKSIEDSLAALQEKVGRTINSRNAQKISQAIDLLTEVIGGSAPASIQQKGWDTYISADIEDLFDLRESIDPVLEYYGLEAEVDDSGILIKELGAEDALVALESIVSNFDEIQTKGIGRRIGRAARGGPNAGRFVQRDGDGDGKFSLTPGAPDETPISKLPKRGAPDKPRVYDGSGASTGVFPGRARDRDFEKRREELAQSLRDSVGLSPFNFTQDELDELDYGPRPGRPDSFGRRNRSGRDSFGNPVETAGDKKRRREAENRMRARREREAQDVRKRIEERERTEERERSQRAGEKVPVRRKPIDQIDKGPAGDAEIEKEIADYDAAAEKRPLTAPQRDRNRALKKERARRAEEAGKIPKLGDSTSLRSTNAESGLSDLVKKYGPPKGGFGSVEGAKKYADKIQNRVENLLRRDRGRDINREVDAGLALEFLEEAILNDNENDDVVNYLLERYKKMPKIDSEDEFISFDPKEWHEFLRDEIEERRNQ